jgi:hypothetical protein
MTARSCSSRLHDVLERDIHASDLPVFFWATYLFGMMPPGACSATTRRHGGKRGNVRMSNLVEMMSGGQSTCFWRSYVSFLLYVVLHWVWLTCQPSFVAIHLFAKSLLVATRCNPQICPVMGVSQWVSSSSLLYCPLRMSWSPALNNQGKPEANPE